MTHEFNIFTNDGWVVTLVTDKAVNLGDVTIHSIIVQPKDDYYRRVAEHPLCVQRQLYTLMPRTMPTECL